MVVPERRHASRVVETNCGRPICSTVHDLVVCPTAACESPAYHLSRPIAVMGQPHSAHGATWRRRDFHCLRNVLLSANSIMTTPAPRGDQSLVRRRSSSSCRFKVLNSARRPRPTRVYDSSIATPARRTEAGSAQEAAAALLACADAATPVAPKATASAWSSGATVRFADRGGERRALAGTIDAQGLPQGRTCWSKKARSSTR